MAKVELLFMFRHKVHSHDDFIALHENMLQIFLYIIQNIILFRISVLEIMLVIYDYNNHMILLLQSVIFTLKSPFLALCDLYETHLITD